MVGEDPSHGFPAEGIWIPTAEREGYMGEESTTTHGDDEFFDSSVGWTQKTLWSFRQR
jgi:hypothetical protein